MVDLRRRSVLRAVGTAVAAAGTGTVAGASAGESERLEVSIFQSRQVHDAVGTTPQEVVADHLRAALELAGYEPAEGSPVVGVADPEAAPRYVPDRVVADRVWGEYEVRTPTETPASVLGDPIPNDFHEWGSSYDVNGDGDKEQPHPVNGDVGWDQYHNFLHRTAASAKDSNLLLLGQRGGRSFNDSGVKSVDLSEGDSPLTDIDGVRMARSADDPAAQKLYHAIHEIGHTLTGTGNSPGGDHDLGYHWVNGDTRYVTMMGRYTLGGRTENACGADVEIPDADETKLFFGFSRCMHSPGGRRGFESNDREPDWRGKASERRPRAWFNPADWSGDPDERFVVPAGRPVELDAGLSVPALGASIDHEWTVDGEAVDGGERLRYTFSPGDHEVRLRVRSGGETDAVTQTVVAGRPPEPALSVAPDYPDPGETVTLDAGDTVAGDAPIERYEWTFETADGSETATGETVERSFAAGTRTLALTAVDRRGLSATVTDAVVVGDADCATAEHTRRTGSLEAGDSETFTYRGQTDDPCRVAIELRADGDHDLFVTLNGRTPTRSDYDRRSRRPGGEESVVVDDASADLELGVLVDAYGGRGNYTLDVTEWGTGDNDAPTARVDASALDATENETVSFDATGSTDPDSGASIERYDWEIETADGTETATGPTVEHAFRQGGRSYDVTLTVTDELGATDSETVTVEVAEDWWPLW